MGGSPSSKIPVCGLSGSSEGKEETENVETLAPENDNAPRSESRKDDPDDDIDEPGPLTRSVMEVQAKLVASSQEEGVPWLRR